MAPTNIEWVAQVSLLRPGCSGRTDSSGETQVSKSRATHSMSGGLFFLQSVEQWDLRFLSRV
jgi:hypothetical protein